MNNPITDIDNSELVAASGAQFDIKKFLYKLIGFLPWIIISVMIGYTVSQLYLRYTPKVHRVAANLLIKDDAESSPDYNILRELGVMPGSREVQNQIDILQSYELAAAVVDSLNLQVKLLSQGRIASSTLYGQSRPVFIHLIDEDTAESQLSSYQLLLDDNTFSLINENERTEYHYKDTFLLSGKRVSIERNELVKADPAGYTLIIQDKRQVAVGIRHGITVTRTHDMGGIIEIAMLNESPQLAVDIINTLIHVFNVAGITDKNIVGYKATRFVSERVDTVSRELDELELKAEVFKRTNKMTDITAAGNEYLTQTHKYDDQQVEQTGQLQMLKAVEQFIQESKNYTDIIPAQNGLTEPTLSGLITLYNQEVLSYQEQLKISTQKDPVVARIKDKLADIKGNILKNIQSIREGYQIRL
ncbi:MAG TPA: hypothetical protein VN958_20235, partial [Chitinophagaceae bacterium]|nr:hypothetical protein [Chitinophagaceae bacterium]